MTGRVTVVASLGTTPDDCLGIELEADPATSARAAEEIDFVGRATIAYSSEDPAHPIEHMLDGCSGPGATRWVSARPDTVELIVIEFNRPQVISRLAYEVEEKMRERTQQVRAEVGRRRSNLSANLRARLYLQPRLRHLPA